ncbi:septum formation family protein [Micromonospora sp. NPDC048830]|uniref:septum formation family protein n=1 Tax=Micromonospora sp. NPDC048830 TaxID=3364257 RepID=UPI003712AD1F
MRPAAGRQPPVRVRSAGRRLSPRPGDNASGDGYRPVGCQERHEAETFHVGRFAGADAALSEPPAPGSEAGRRAYASCSTALNEFVGDVWQTSRLSLRVVLPTAKGWAADERWFRCDVVELLALDVLEPSPRANSLAGALRAPSPFHHGCYNSPTFGPDDRLQTMPPAACTGPHSTEFVGVWWSDALAAGTSPSEEDLIDGCFGVAADYVGVPTEDLGDQTYVYFLLPSDEDWGVGDSGVLCFLHTDGAPLRRSLAGVGRRGLPG